MYSQKKQTHQSDANASTTTGMPTVVNQQLVGDVCSSEQQSTALAPGLWLSCRVDGGRGEGLSLVVAAAMENCFVAGYGGGVGMQALLGAVWCGVEWWHHGVARGRVGWGVVGCGMWCSMGWRPRLSKTATRFLDRRRVYFVSRLIFSRLLKRRN